MASSTEIFPLDLCKVIKGPKDTPPLRCIFRFDPTSGISPTLVDVNGTAVVPGLLLTKEGIAHKKRIHFR